jgi:hypothetical protein
MLRSELCCTRSNVGAGAGLGLAGATYFGRVEGSRGTRAARLLAAAASLAIRRPMRSITHRLSSVPAATYMFVESSDWSSSRSAIVAVANQPKICCAHDSAIGIAAFPIGRVQHASSQMSFPLRNHTQHSSERTIGRHMLRATYGDIPIAADQASELRTRGLGGRSGRTDSA